MPVRRLPVRPDLKQLHRQAKEFLRALHAGDEDAIAEWREHHPQSMAPTAAKLADAQLVLARGYRAASWTRLVDGVRLAEAIWQDAPEEVRAIVLRNPALIHEHVLIRTDSNWGPPMTYAANLGRDSKRPSPKNTGIAPEKSGERSSVQLPHGKNGLGSGPG